MTALLQRFEDITKKDILTAGGKGANLGEMVHAGIPVPEGAVLTTEAYRLYVKENKIDLKAPAEEIRKAFLTGSMPKELHVTLLEYYIGIGEGERIAVRSSATAEDLEDAAGNVSECQRRRGTDRGCKTLLCFSMGGQGCQLPERKRI